MKTICSVHWLSAGVVGLLMTLPGLAQPDPPAWGAGGVPGSYAECVQDVLTCEQDLVTCEEQPCAIFPGDGYTGVGLQYEQPDPADGTFTDLNTGLMWEIKTDDGSIHDVDNVYTESTDGSAPNDVFNVFLAQLNTYPSLGGFTDWRLPTIKELQSLVDYSVPSPGPTVDSGLPGFTATNAQVGYEYYMSSTTVADETYRVWGLRFDTTNVGPIGRSCDWHVRAVRNAW